VADIRRLLSPQLWPGGRKRGHQYEILRYKHQFSISSNGRLKGSHPLFHFFVVVINGVLSWGFSRFWVKYVLKIKLNIFSHTPKKENKPLSVLAMFPRSKGET